MVEKVKGVVFELLRDATRRGDKVALVAFKGGVPEATVGPRSDEAAIPLGGLPSTVNLRERVKAPEGGDRGAAARLFDAKAP